MILCFDFNFILGVISPEELTLTDWRFPIEIVLREKNHTSVDEIESIFEPQIHEIIVVGHLHKGRLHGPVVMKGVFSMDPIGHCSNVPYDGLGFVGHFSNGIPTGICWRELHGGAWLYGKVGSMGQFTGTVFSL